MIPMRTCVGCGQRAPKPQLERFVRPADALVDPRSVPRVEAPISTVTRLHPSLARGKGRVRSLRWTPSPSARAALAAVVDPVVGEGE
jgi:hypothetical protein